MRSYSALLLFENIFDSIPTGNPDFQNLANSIFNPNLMIVENNCGTTLGKFDIVNFEAEGLVELSTGQVISRSRIEQLLGQGVYEVATRHTSSCISKGGVCAACYKATFQDKPTPKVFDRVNIAPEFLFNAEVISVKAGASTTQFATDTEMFDKVYVYSAGTLLKSPDNYSISGNNFNLVSPVAEDTIFVLRCIRQDTAPFLVWLSNTYAGSLFGMKPLPSQQLPTRSLLLSSLLEENRLQLISEYINQVDSIPEAYAKYSDQIKDPLEKALFMLALYCIYSNVIS